MWPKKTNTKKGTEVPGNASDEVLLSKVESLS